jgi:SAM-dependent methyltransferase
LRPKQVVGIDASPLAVRAAQVRATGHDLSSSLVSFLDYSAGEKLPFEDDCFDLTVCSSVLEYVTCRQARTELITELGRVTRPSGYVFISTPNPLRLNEHHSGRFLGDYLHRPGYPWATRPWEFSRMFSGWREIPATKYHRRKLTELLGPRVPIPEPVIKAVSWIAPWQNRLFQKLSASKKAPLVERSTQAGLARSSSDRIAASAQTRSAVDGGT